MFIQQLINGITIGCNYALVAIGFTMVFGVLRLVNLANGSVFALGAFFTLTFYAAVRGHFLLSLLCAVLSTALVGVLVDRLALYRLRKKNAARVSGMITTLAIATIIDNAIVILFGSQTRSFKRPVDFGNITFGKVVIGRLQIYMLLSILAIVGLLSLLIYKTKLGKSMLATAQDPEAAMLMGINVNHIISLTFAISAALACFAGSMIGLYYQAIDVTLGASVGMKSFAAAVLGGVGNIPGAFVGGVVIGVVETFVAVYVSSGLRDAIAFSILIIVLLIKPAGIFGRKTVEKV